MTAQRYKQDALAALASVEASIKSRRKTLRDTANASTAATTESLLRTLEAKATALRVEAAALPERPPREFAWSSSGNDWLKPSPVAPDDPIFETLEIPEFLRRAA